MATLFNLPTPGYLRIAGPDRAAFLQRQTTNDVNALGPGSVMQTALTTPTARILDVFWLLPEPEAIGLLTLPGRTAATRQYLKSRIFFMDKVTLDDASASLAQIELDGLDAAEMLRQLDVPVPVAGQVLAYELAGAGQLEKQPLRILGPTGLSGTGYRLLVPAAAEQTVLGSLLSAGATALSFEEREILRVEAGLPAADHELTEEYTPLETGLGQIVSMSKGCYTGQEVLARQVNYDKVTRHLAGLRLEAAVPIGAGVTAEGKPAGMVTSVVISPRLGAIALAVLRRPYHEPGTAVSVGNINGTVDALPFNASQTTVGKSPQS